jgi:hypothetical protein
MRETKGDFLRIIVFSLKIDLRSSADLLKFRDMFTFQNIKIGKENIIQSLKRQSYLKNPPKCLRTTQKVA